MDMKYCQTTGIIMKYYIEIFQSVLITGVASFQGVLIRGSLHPISFISTDHRTLIYHQGFMQDLSNRNFLFCFLAFLAWKPWSYIIPVL